MTEGSDNADPKDPSARARRNHISSLLNENEREIPLDPAMMASSVAQQARDEISDRESWKAERKLQLQREADLMKEALAAKERELAELG